MRLRADFGVREVVRPGDERWRPSPAPGVERRMLDRIGDEVARATSIVRYAPGSSFPRHVHDGGEEFFVLEGLFGDEHGEYPAGTYVRNPIGTAHAPWAGPSGAVLFVKLHQFDARDLTPVVVDTGEWSERAGEPGGERLSLHAFEREHVSLVRLAPNSRIDAHDHVGGEEQLVLAGALRDELGEYPRGTWIRNPPGLAHTRWTDEGALLLVKTGHLAPHE